MSDRPMVTLYGIRNCDTCRRAWKWLEDQGVEYRFHDLQRDGIDRDMIDEWMGAVGGRLLVNRRSRTWRELPEERRASLDDAALRALLAEQPTLIKRPVTAWPDGGVTLGFDPGQWRQRID